MATRNGACLGFAKLSTNRPPASNLVLLSELARISAGTKVRFIGCVNAYDAPNARLVLVHTFPFHRRPRDLGAAANVVDGTLIDPKLAGRSAVSCREVKLDVSLILPPASAKELYEVGAWVSVIGYVAYPGRNSRSTGSKDNTRGYRSAIEVQALVLGPSGGLGSSGGVQDERYMRGLEAKRKGMRILDKARRSFKTEKEA